MQAGELDATWREGEHREPLRQLVEGIGRTALLATELQDVAFLGDDLRRL